MDQDIYLEVGVFEGRALVWLLENILTHPTARATCIDLFPDDLEQRFRRNLDLSGYASKVTVMKGTSDVELRKLPLDAFDIISRDPGAWIRLPAHRLKAKVIRSAS